MEWNGEIMRKKLFSSFIVFTLVLSLTIGSTSKAYATGGFGEIIIGTLGVITVEEAVGAVLLMFGLHAASDAVYKNQEQLKEWAGERIDDIVEVATEVYDRKDEAVLAINNFFELASKGVLDKTSKAWSVVKTYAFNTIRDMAQNIENVIKPAPDVPSVGYIGPCVYTWEDSVGLNKIYMSSQGRVIYGIKDGITTFYSNEPFVVQASFTPFESSEIMFSADNAQAQFLYGNWIYTSTCSAAIGAPNVSPIDAQEYVESYMNGISNDAYLDAIAGIKDLIKQGIDKIDLVQSQGANISAEQQAALPAGAISVDWSQIMDKPAIDGVTGAQAGSIANALAGIAAGSLSWANVLDKVGVTPVVNENVIDDTGVTDKPAPKPVTNPVSGNYVFDLRNIFPFCLPFDIADFLGCLAATPEAPKFTIEIPTLRSDGSVSWHKLELDFSQFDDIAVWVRNMELFAFIVGLAMVTRSNMIRG